jgi:hypothetical protein
LQNGELATRGEDVQFQGGAAVKGSPGAGEKGDEDMN